MEYTNKREKTTKAIMDAFVDLYRENDISQITVRMICEKADINRSTFYMYYTDIYKLRETMEQGIVQDVAGLILSNLTNVRNFDPNTIVKILATYIKEHDGMPLIFIKRNGNELIKVAYNLFCSHMEKIGLPLTEEKEHEILISITYHISGIIALLDFWEREHPGEDIDPLISRAARLANEGPLTVIRNTML